MDRRKTLVLVLVIVAVLSLGTAQVLAGQSKAPAKLKQIVKSSMGIMIDGTKSEMPPMRQITNAERRAAAKRAADKRAGLPSPFFTGKTALGFSPLFSQKLAAAGVPTTFSPQGTPDYLGGIVPNWAQSPLPTLDASGNPVGGTGIRKFVDSLPGLGYANRNNLGQYMPVAKPDTTTYPGSDYYVIELVQYQEKLHSDVPTTTLRGYRQANTTDTAVSKASYLGPVIVAQRDRPVRVKFVNKIATGTAGDLFIPVDTTAMGAGLGPDGVHKYTQNRATLHLHGGATPWISDGTPHQWTTPATENTPYPKGVSVQNVPDMPAAGPGELTFFYTNQQSARLMFYHDHAYGLTRLNVYAGEAGGYVLRDKVEKELIDGNVSVPLQSRQITPTVQPGTIPADEIPLIIQDKTFVPSDAQLLAQDPTWDRTKWGTMGNLWFPHVYMPNQNPNDLSGANAMGRWDYGPWFWPIFQPAIGPTPAGDPGTPNPSLVPEAFMDTPLVNGTAYPFTQVGRKPYRLRILNACNDRFLNLQLYYAKSNTPTVDASGSPLQTDSGDVPMVPAVVPSGNTTWPANWPTDNREGGVPDPAAAGPKMIQIGTEGGFLPKPVILDNQPVNYEYNRRNIVVLNITTHTLLLGPAERADVIVDFSQVPDGSKLIMYNDAPAPVPAFDTRNDYYTGDPDQTSSGGAPTTKPGYGPNTRTIMQFQVSGTASAPYDVNAIQTALPAAFKASQDPIIVPQTAYGSPTDNFARIQSTSMTFTPDGTTTPINIQMQPKAIQELFEMDYGRMNATLGVELPFTNSRLQTTLPFGYIDPTTENITDSVSGGPVQLADGTQIWKITHNGVDTHAIHFHLFNVQVVNRVGWDGAIRPVDPNELGWKETVRMNPLEDCIVAMRAVSPTLPFKIGDSVRPMDPTHPIGSTIGFAGFDPTTGNPITVTNQMTNFGWEYVWHCHLLGHEENDMMRPIKFDVSPAAPTTLTAVSTSSASRSNATVSWKNNWSNPKATNNLIQRATNAAFTSNVTTVSVGPSIASYVDNAVTEGTTYYYRVRAENANSYSVWTNTGSVKIAPRVLMAPYSLGLVSRTGSSLRIDWAIPNNTAPYTSITVQYSRTSKTGPWTQYTLPANALVTNITGLRSNTTYWIRIVAVGSGGATAPSAVFTAKTSP